MNIPCVQADLAALHGLGEEVVEQQIGQLGMLLKRRADVAQKHCRDPELWCMHITWAHRSG